MKGKMFTYLIKGGKKGNQGFALSDLNIKMVLEACCALVNIQLFVCKNTNLHVAENVTWLFSFTLNRK